MIEKIKLWIMSILLKKYALGYAVQAYKGIQGYKSQICAVGMIIVYIAQIFGQIDSDTANTLYAALGGFGSFSFMAKLKQYEGLIKEVADMVKKDVDKLGK